MGVHLSGILLAGIGAVFLGRAVLDAALRLFPEDRRGWAAEPVGRGLVAGLCIIGLVLVLAPAWSALDTYDGHNATNIGFQAGADTEQSPQIDSLLAYVRDHPRGRVYAGSPTNWGHELPRRRRPGLQVPREQGRRRGRVHAADGVADDRSRVLLRRDQPGRLPALRHRVHDHPRDLRRPRSRRSGSAVRATTACGRSRSPATSTCTTRPACSTATRANVGTQSETLLDSPLLDEQRDLTVAFNGHPASAPTARAGAGAERVARDGSSPSRRTCRTARPAPSSRRSGGRPSCSAPPTTRDGAPP